MASGPRLRESLDLAMPEMPKRLDINLLLPNLDPASDNDALSRSIVAATRVNTEMNFEDSHNGEFKVLFCGQGNFASFGSLFLQCVLFYNCFWCLKISSDKGNAETKLKRSLDGW